MTDIKDRDTARIAIDSILEGVTNLRKQLQATAKDGRPAIATWRSSMLKHVEQMESEIGEILEKFPNA